MLLFAESMGINPGGQFSSYRQYNVYIASKYMDSPVYLLNSEHEYWQNFEMLTKKLGGLCYLELSVKYCKSILKMGKFILKSKRTAWRH